MFETCVAWSDSQQRLTWVPDFTAGGILFKGPHCSTPSGTTVRIHASGAFRAYVIVESDYKGGQARSGGYTDMLPRLGWRKEKAAPSWGDSASTMVTFSKRAPEGTELVLPRTIGKVVFCVVVVSVASSTGRLTEELKQTFREWDPEGKSAMRREDL